MNNGILKLKTQHYLHQHKTNETTGYKSNKVIQRKLQILIKKSKKFKINGNIVYVHRWENNIVKMSVRLNLTYIFNAIKIKIPESYIVDIHKLILKCIQKGERSRETIEH